MGTVVRFANTVGSFFVSLAPDQLTQEFSKADRRGRIYMDTGRNGFSATFAAAYTVRAKPGAPVSAPIEWEELDDAALRSDRWTIRTIVDRVAEKGDLFAPAQTDEQELPDL